VWQLRGCEGNESGLFSKQETVVTLQGHDSGLLISKTVRKVAEKGKVVSAVFIEEKSASGQKGGKDE
jgi:hypothetical protein